MSKNLPHAGTWAALFAFCAAMVVVFVTSKRSPTPPPTADSNAYVLQTRPEQAMSLTDVAAKLRELDVPADDATDAPVTVTLVGRIAASDVDPFESGRATFLLSEAPSDDHATDDPDHADNCPFCKRRAKSAPTALVQIIDQESGDIVAQDARSLVGLDFGKRVTLTGTATFNADVNMITVQTGGIFAE